MVHLNPGQGSILKDLMQITKDWRADKQRTIPLRHCLANSHDLPVALQIPEAEGLTREQRAQAQCHEVQPAGWIREMPISQQWGTEKTLVVSKTAALTLDDTMDMIESIKSNMEDPRVTLRFHSLKKLDGDSSKAVAFLWMISNRDNLELWQRLQQLSHHSCLQLIQMSLRPGNLQRSPLARQLQSARSSR